MAEACFVAENMTIPLHFPDTKENVGKRQKKFMARVLLKQMHIMTEKQQLKNPSEGM
jgi:hypothetical protein